MACSGWCASLLLLANGAATASVAKDLVALGELITPAYIAMNLAVICAQHDPRFLSDTRGPRGTAVEYAQHVKDEAILALTHDEALVVLKTAADAARSTTRRELQTLTSNHPAIGNAEVAQWCDDRAKSYVRTFIERHDGTHQAFLEQIERAKR